MVGLICPICRQDLECGPKAWRCSRGHSFDVAREGYVNLLPVQQKNSADPGDSAESLRARRDFLQAGYYRGLAEAAVDRLAPLQAQSLLDVGCGEGTYTAAFAPIVGEIIGLDIAKPAIQLAARRHPGVRWLVASSAALPLADASVDIVSLLFTQLHIAEIERVLIPGGHALVVTPAAEHLWSLREGLFDTVRAHQPDKFLAGFESGFVLADRQEVRLPLQLDQSALRQLLAMTPYVWKARPERRAALEARPCLSTTAAFTLLLLRKRSA